MNRLEKIEKELLKAREKAAEWQARVRDLEKQKQEEENVMIVQAVRSLKLTPAELLSFLDKAHTKTASSAKPAGRSFLSLLLCSDKLCYRPNTTCSLLKSFVKIPAQIPVQTTFDTAVIKMAHRSGAKEKIPFMHWTLL